MTQPAGAAETGAQESTTDDTTTAETGQTGSPVSADTTDWKAKYEAEQAEAAKWKAMSRKVEDKLKAKNDEAAKASMTESEKATADAEAKGRKAAAREYGEKLAAAKFETAAAKAGVDLGELMEDLSMSRFVDDDGEIDSEAIAKAVKKFAKLAPKPSAGKSGGEFTGGSGAGPAITEEQLARMSPAEIQKAYDAGKLKHLM